MGRQREAAVLPRPLPVGEKRREWKEGEMGTKVERWNKGREMGTKVGDGNKGG